MTKIFTRFHRVFPSELFHGLKDLLMISFLMTSQTIQARAVTSTDGSGVIALKLLLKDYH